MLNPVQESGGTSIEQCYETLDHDLRLTFRGSRDGEVTTINLGSYIDDVYLYSYPECDPYVSYGFAETRLDVGRVEPGDVIVVEYLRDGVLYGPPFSATYPDDMIAWDFYGGGGVPRAEGAVRDRQSAGGGGTGSGALGDGAGIGGFFVDFLESSTLELKADRDSILVTEAARLTVEGVTDPDAEITLTSATPYGRLVRVASGDTTAVAGPLAWSEIEGSEILFVADGKWPKVDAAVQVKGTLSDGSSGTTTLAVLAPKVRFVRQDDALIPTPSEDTANACVRVSKFKTDVELPGSVGFDSPYAAGQSRAGNGDPDTFRPQVMGVATGRTVEFRIEVERGGATVGSATVAAVEGVQTTSGGASVVTYRASKHLRLVSNAPPPSGRPSGSRYDDEHAGDQTLRVELSDVVRAYLVVDGKDTGGLFELPVGRPGSESGRNAARTGRLVWHTFNRVNSDPAFVRDRVSEDWAQASIQFENIGAGDSFSSAVDDNLILVEFGRSERRSGRTSSAGSLTATVAVGGASPQTLTLTYAEDLTLLGVVAVLRQQIADQLGLSALNIHFQSAVTLDESKAELARLNAVDRFFLAIAPGQNITVSNVRGDRAVRLRTQSFNYNSLAFHEVAAVGRNVGDGDDETIDVVVLPNGSLRGATVGREVKGKGIPKSFDTAGGVPNTMYLSEDGADGSDEFPMVAGHELGHVLLEVGHNDPGSKNPFGPIELMSGRVTDRVEDLSSAKRLTESIQDRARSVSAVPGNQILQ